MRYSIFLILMASMSLNAGSIHKWTDEEGNVHYGDSPPASAKTEGVRVLAAPTNPGKSLPRLGSSGGDAGGNAGSDPGNNQQVPEDQARLACEKAREDLKVIGKSDRIKLRDADGNTRYMTSEEIEERRIQSEADVERFCQ